MLSAGSRTRVTGLLVAGVLLVSVVGCAGSGGKSAQQAQQARPAQPVLMRIGTVTVDPHQQNATMAEFKKRIEAKLGDRIKVELYPASQLGSIPQMVQGLQNGSVQALVIPSGFYGTVAPAINVIDLPYFFANSESAFKILNGGGDKELAEYLQTKGMVPLGWLLAPDRLVISRSPIAKLDDFKGQKIRTFPGPVAQGEINAWGGAATPIDTSEVPVALQQGTINGVASDVSFFHSMKLFQTAKYLLMAPKGAVTAPFMVSKTWLDGLPADIREAVTKTAKDAIMNYEADYVRKYAEKAMAEMKQGGLQVVEPLPEFTDRLRAASKAVHDKYVASDPQAPAIYDGLKKGIAAQAK